MKLPVVFIFFCLLLVISKQAPYSPAVASYLAYMSFFSYETPTNINAWNCSQCSRYPMINTKAFTNTSSDIQGFTGYSPASNAIILAFRGSSNIDNWIIDFTINQVSYPKCTNCKVHNGFFSGYSGLKSIIISQLQSLVALHRGAKIYITGHSLGAAIALLASTDVKDLIADPTALVTFGQPRIGNTQFAKWISSQVTDYRVVHYADIVAHMPGQIQGYQHGGTQIWYDKAMQVYKICQGDSPDCSNSLSVTSYTSADHSILLYMTLKVGWPNIFELFWSKMSSMIQKLSSKPDNLVQE